MKKKKKIIYNFCYLKIRPTRSNIFVTLTTLEGKVILKSSAGLINFSGKKKSTGYVLECTVRDIIITMRKNNIYSKCLIVQFFGSLRTRSYKKSVYLFKELKVKSLSNIINIVKYGHNGMRLKKQKRL